MKQDNIEFAEELCPFLETCRQTIDANRCKDYYDKCIVYQRLKVLEKDKPMTGLQRFIQRYPEYRFLGIGGRI